ncbi:MAG: hypothetical protein LBH96_06610 [Candidatus Peribacteria bacterium]|nr:hypothetical protein [Candidatus Peribacteria bacterium]
MMNNTKRMLEGQSTVSPNLFTDVFAAFLPLNPEDKDSEYNASAMRAILNELSNALNDGDGTKTSTYSTLEEWTFHHYADETLDKKLKGIKEPKPSLSSIIV